MKGGLASLVAAALVVLLSACSSSYSTIRDEGIGYAITRAQAKEVVSSSILSHFSPDYVNPGPAESLTSSGYIRILLDTHTVNATALPIRGALKSGEPREGYGFEVNAYGTIPITGGAKARAVYDLLKQQASSAGEVIQIKK
jgi:hypothetical protein